MQNLVAVSHRVGVCSRSQKSGVLRLRCLGIGDVRDLVETAAHRNTPLPTRFTIPNLVALGLMVLKSVGLMMKFTMRMRTTM